MKTCPLIRDRAFDSSWSIYAIIALGVLLRLVALYLISPLPLKSDPVHYHHMALQLLHQAQFHPYWPPGLPYFLCFFYSFFGESEQVAKACMIVPYVAFAGFLFLLSKKISDRKTANVVVLIFSLFPTFIYHSVYPLTQLPLAAILAAVAYFTLRSGKTTPWFHGIALGVIMGSGVLIRPSLLLLAFLIPLYFLVRYRMIRFSFVMAATVLLIGGFWIYKVHKMVGYFVMVNHASSLNFFYGNCKWTPLYKTWYLGSHPLDDDEFNAFKADTKKEPPNVRDKIYRQRAIQHILSRPDLFALRTLNRFRVFFAFDTYVGSCLIKGHNINKWIGLGIIAIDAAFYCSIVGLALLFFFLPPQMLLGFGARWILVGIVVVYAFPYWIAFASPTYHFPVVPILGPFAVITARRLLSKPAEIWEHIRCSGRKKYLALVCLILFVYIQIEWFVVMRSSI